MDWKGLECWWYGHNVRQATAVITEDKKYHGHTTTRKYGKCTVCGKGTLENEIWTFPHSKSFMERNSWIIPTILGVVIVSCILAVSIIPPVYFANKGCLDAGVQMSLEAKYSWWSGCYYKVNGRWIADNLLSVVDLIK